MFLLFGFHEQDQLVAGIPFRFPLDELLIVFPRLMSVRQGHSYHVLLRVYLMQCWTKSVICPISFDPSSPALSVALLTLHEYACLTRWLGIKSNMGQMTLLASVHLALYLSYESALPIGY